MALNFIKANNEKDFKNIYEYTTDAFSDSPDFNWDLEGIQAEVKDGWELESAYNEKKDVIAALFYKVDKKSNTLLTKNTGLQINHQGLGYSHEIKNYFEAVAKKKVVNSIAHFCRVDNFRAYSLNESHNYKKTTNTLNDGLVVEWIKKIK